MMSRVSYTIFQVSQQRIQAVEILFLTVVLSAGVLYSSRKQKISFRFTVGWLTLFGFMALGGLAIPRIERIADQFEVSPAAFIAAISTFLLLGLCVQLSISISGLQRQLRKVNEDVALQKKAIDDLRDSR
jgi:hypothetical protein